MSGKNKADASTSRPGQRVKHTPIRTCVVCREKTGKRTLTRVVRTADGVVIDPSGKMNGRGAYLCEQESCWERAVNTDILAKALKTQLSADDRQRLNQAKLSS
ncbi:MAG: YlxR family protein [bacterium]|nr:YlxR family protein [bacterium]